MAILAAAPHTSQILRNKRYVALFIFMLSVLGLFVWHSPRLSFSFFLSRDEAVRRVQSEAFELAPNQRPVCLWQRFHETRYAGLATDKRTVYIAMNLNNNENVLPTFLQELPHIVRRLGEKRVYVSVYENGSEDKTPELLGLLSKLLDAMGVAHNIVARGRSEYSHKEDGHRISELVKFRNKAMEPLYSGVAARSVPKRAFDEVLWINDVFHCAADVLEILLQKRLQGANQACGLDWAGWGDDVIYDRWVLRTITGRVFYAWEELVSWMYPADDAPRRPDNRGMLPELLPHDPEDRARLEASLPLQVFSCWNGAAAFDAAAFLPPHNLRFRQAKADMDEHGKPKEFTEIISECFLSSVDLWKAGMGKVLIAPRASFAYNLPNYEHHRRDQLKPVSSNLEDERIGWLLRPPTQIAFQDNAVWNEPERWAAWDEQ